MPISAPVLRDLKSFAGKFDFEGNGYSIMQWEVFVPQNRCILWCVVLSFLRSADSSKKNFYPRLKALILRPNYNHNLDSEHLRIVQSHEFHVCTKNSVSRLNPFRNYMSYFFDENLNSVVHVFEKLLEASYKEFQQLRVKQKMQVICDFLSCRILWIREDKMDEFQPQHQETTQIYQTFIFFSSTIPGNGCGETVRFSFSLTKSRADELRELALKEILKAVEIPKEMRKSVCDVSKENDGTSSFLIPLLQSDNVRNSVPQLYRSSYAIYKLDKAGYKTDPRDKDHNGLSAFYYALRHSDILYALYKSDNLRDPDSNTFSNFWSLGSVLKSDREASNDFETIIGTDRELARLHSKQLSFLNECLSEISAKIHFIRQDSNDSDLNKVVNQKKIIESILEVYNKYFFISSDSSERLSSLEHYSKYKTYYDNLDNTVTLLLCDNIFLLKGMLLLPKDPSYSDLESAFLLATVSNKYFLSILEKLAKKRRNSTRKVSSLMDLSFAESLHLIPMLERFYLRQTFTAFCKCLKETEIMEKNLRTCVPNDEIALMLSNHPVVRDEAVLNRLRRFMDMVKEPKLSGVKLKMVVERCLQVVGESLKVDDNPFTIRHLLRSCLPENVVSTLIKIRNKLSKSCELDLKISAEDDDVLFDSMRSELVGIHKAFELVYEVQEKRIREYLVSRGLEVLQNKFVPNKIINENFEKTIRYLNDMLHQTLNTYPFHKKSTEFKVILTNSICAAKKTLDGITQLSNKRAIEVLWPVEYLLQFLRDKCKLYSLDETLDKFKTLSNDSNVLNVANDLIEMANSFTLGLAEKPSTKTFETMVEAENIQKFNDILTRKVSSDAAKASVLEEIPDSVKERIKRTENLQIELKKEMNEEQKEKINSVIAGLELDSLHLPEKPKRELKKINRQKSCDKAIRILKKVKNPLLTLDLVFRSKYVKESELESVCDELQLSEATKDMLLKMIKHPPAPIPHGDPLHHLLDRMEKLKQIAILDHPNVKDMWEKASNPQTRQFMAHKIVWRYSQEPVFQSTMEMLLFDCLELLKETVSPLRVKASHLFSGINVRNVLAHGDPLLDTMGSLLDPEDLPMELVKKMIQLLEDESAVRAIHEAWKISTHFAKTRNSSDAQDVAEDGSQGDSSSLVRYIENSNDDKIVKLKECIVVCDYWRDYCNLMKADDVPKKIKKASLCEKKGT